MITEIGGTVGDIESLPFLEAARQVRHDVGRDNCFFLHVSLVPYIGPSGELKTKPTQHSVAALRSIGIQPDAIVCRADRELPSSIKRKISLMCDVDEEAVVTAADAPSIYDIPKVLHREGLDAYVVRRLNLPFRDVDWTLWDDLLQRVHHPNEEVTVALVGKYVDLPDAYLSVAEALRAGGFAHEAKVNIAWIPSDECETPDGRGQAARRRRRDLRARRLRHPRHRGQARRAHLRPHPRHPDPRPVPGPAVHGDRVRPQRGRPREGGVHRVRPRLPRAGDRDDGRAARLRRGRRRPGRHDAARPLPGRPARRARSSGEAYGADRVEERHRHRYEVNNAYREHARGGRAGLLRHLAGPQPGRVRRAAPRRAPLLRRHPGAPRAALAPDPAAPAVRRAWSARRSSGSASCGSRSTSPGCAARPPTTRS